MKVIIKGTSQTVDLTQKDYVGAGGEGEVYVKGSTAYKVYFDPAKMIPTKKIEELSAITDPRVVRPEQVLLDSRHHPVGYTMRFIKGGWALCQLFPRVFRERNKLTEGMVLELVKKLQEGVGHVHQAKVLLVDLNEMNFMVSKKFDEIYFIDADSYQTEHYPATALMPSIRDWKTPLGKFTENSDWFSFGIVSFQMFTGIHPYKGKHPKVNGFEDRMKAGISVFDKHVSVPAVVYPLSVIPKEYLHWYKTLFEKGDRCPPPDRIGVVVVAAPVAKQIVGSTQVSVTEIGDYEDEVIRVCGTSSHLIVVTKSAVWLNNRKVLTTTKQVNGIGYSNYTTPVVVTGGNHDDIMELTNLDTGESIPFGLQASSVESSDGRIYFKLADHIYEVKLTSAGRQVIATTTEAAQVLEHATRLYPGVAVQRLLGSTYASLFTDVGTTHQVHLPELDNYKVLDAKYDSGVLMVIGGKKGVYSRLVFKFNGTFTTTECECVGDITPTGLNFVVLESGLCINMNEDEQLEVFSAKLGHPAKRVIQDPALSGDMIIGDCFDQVVVAKGSKVYKLSTGRGSK